MNPEFRRNLWLELTPTRLGVVLFALAAILLLAYVAAGNAQTMSSVARTCFFVLVMLWGGKLAAEAVVTEINERTWDSQRMSALGPWSMSWGKLFGAPVAAWVAGLVALAVLLASSDRNGILLAVQLVLVGVLCHATAMAMSLQSIRKGRQPGRVKTFLFQLIGLAVAGLSYLPSYSAWLFGTAFGGSATIGWFGFAVPAFEFGLASLAVFTLWAVLAVYRLMRLELQKPSTPIVWAAFLLFVVLYETGLALGGNASFTDFSGKLRQTIESAGPSVAAAAAYFLLSVLCYIAVFTEPKSPVAMGQFFAAWRDRRWGQAWALTPRWLITLIFTALALIASLIVLRRHDLALESATITDGVLISAFFFTLRNIGIVLWFNFRPDAQRSDMLAFVTIFVLSGILPFIVAGMRALDAIPLFAPWGSQSAGLLVALPAVLETAVVYFLVWHAWRTGQRLRLKVA